MLGGRFRRLGMLVAYWDSIRTSIFEVNKACFIVSPNRDLLFDQRAPVNRDGTTNLESDRDSASREWLTSRAAHAEHSNATQFSNSRVWRGRIA